MKAAFPVMLALALLPAGCAPKGPQVRQLCEVAEQRSHYEGWTLVLEGYLLASGHGSSVTDPRCGHGVPIDWRDDEGGRFSRLNDAAQQFMSPEQRVMVRIRVTGVMRQNREPGMGGIRGWSLQLTDAEVLSVRRIPRQDARRYLIWLVGPSREPFRPSR